MGSPAHHNQANYKDSASENQVPCCLLSINLPQVYHPPYRGTHPSFLWSPQLSVGL